MDDGFGTYWAAAPAVLTAVLPTASDRAKDLGVLNIGYSPPLVVAPIVAGIVLAGLASVAAGLTISKVRSIS